MMLRLPVPRIPITNQSSKTSTSLRLSTKSWARMAPPTSTSMPTIAYWECTTPLEVRQRPLTM